MMDAKNPKNEAAPELDTASAGLQRVARFLVFCAVTGRCLLLEANHCVTFEGAGDERIESKLRGSKPRVKWFVFPAGSGRQPHVLPPRVREARAKARVGPGEHLALFACGEAARSAGGVA